LPLTTVANNVKILASVQDVLRNLKEQPSCQSINTPLDPDLLQKARDSIVNERVTVLPVEVAITRLCNLTSASALGLLHQELKARVVDDPTVDPSLQRIKVGHSRLPHGLDRMGIGAGCVPYLFGDAKKDLLSGWLAGCVEHSVVQQAQGSRTLGPTLQASSEQALHKRVQPR
jgi:hypothetical protein